MRRIRSVLITAGAAIALPLSVYGHGSEFLLAKVQLMKDTSLLVEITADYGENPMLSSEDEARAALKDALSVRAGNAVRPLNDLALVHFEKRAQQDPTAPLPRDPLADDKPHQLLTASWRWKPAEDSVCFEVPQATSQTLIMWVMDQDQPPPVTKWRMLIAGDVTPPVALPRTAWVLDKATMAILACLALLGVASLLRSSWLNRKSASQNQPNLDAAK
jgi:hypothetical protein